MIKTMLLAVLLSVSSVANAITVPIDDNFYAIYDPTNTYPVNVVLGGSEIFTFGFGFTDPTHIFDLVVNVPSNLVGTLEFAITSGPDATGVGYVADALFAGQSANYQFGGAVNATTSNPNTVYVSLRATGMPAQTSYPSIVSSPVPVPAAFWLFGSGLLGLVGIARRNTVTV